MSDRILVTSPRECELSADEEEDLIPAPSRESRRSRDPRSDDEESWTKNPRTLSVMSAIGVCLVGLMAIYSFSNRGLQKPKQQEFAAASTMSVRQLMESDEVADAMARNYLVFHSSGNSSDVEKAEAKAGVKANLAKFCHDMQTQDPTGQSDLRHIHLTTQQKHLILAELHHYGGTWAQGLIHDIADSIQDGSLDNKELSQLKYRLATKLQPRLNQLKGPANTSNEADIGDSDLEELGLDALQPWHFQFKMSTPEHNDTSASDDSSDDQRHITAAKTEGLTLAQIAILLGKLDAELNDNPSPHAPQRELLAPARQLMFAKQKAMMKQTTGKQRLKMCIKVLMTTKKPKEFAQCLAEKCPLLWAWLSKKFLKLTGKPLSVPQ